MGAVPLGMTLIYRYSDSTSDEHFSAIIEGVTAACQRLSMPLITGDTGSYDVPVLGATAIGLCPRGRALLRSNAREGDHLYLTGDVGRALAAYEYFPTRQRASERLPESVEADLLWPWQNVEPALRQGQLLVEHSLSKCAIDTSDGLFASAQLLAEASRVDILIDSTEIPVRSSVKLAANYLRRNWLELAGGVSVDFRLLFTSSPQLESQLRDVFERAHLPVFRVGQVNRAKDRGAALLRDTNGQLIDLRDCW
jgi:thiamine-monophosphate kinase